MAILPKRGQGIMFSIFSCDISFRWLIAVTVINDSGKWKVWAKSTKITWFIYRLCNRFCQQSVPCDLKAILILFAIIGIFFPIQFPNLKVWIYFLSALTAKAELKFNEHDENLLFALEIFRWNLNFFPLRHGT